MCPLVSPCQPPSRTWVRLVACRGQVWRVEAAWPLQHPRSLLGTQCTAACLARSPPAAWPVTRVSRTKALGDSHAHPQSLWLEKNFECCPGFVTSTRSVLAPSVISTSVARGSGLGQLTSWRPISEPYRTHRGAAGNGFARTVGRRTTCAERDRNGDTDDPRGRFWPFGFEILKKRRIANTGRVKFLRS